MKFYELKSHNVLPAGNFIKNSYRNSVAEFYKTNALRGTTTIFPSLFKNSHFPFERQADKTNQLPFPGSFPQTAIMAKARAEPVSDNGQDSSWVLSLGPSC